MIGERIEGRPGFPLGAVFWLIVAAAFVVLASIARNPHCAIFAALPLAIGLALLLVRQRPFVVELTEQGLEFEQPPLSLPYQAIEGLLMPGQPRQRRAEIQVVHPGGVVRIPARLNVRSGELFAFLLHQLPPSGSRDLPGPLARYCAEQAGQFGPERVFTYKARPHRAATRHRVASVVCFASALAGLVWIAIGAFLSKDGGVWMVWGFLTALIGVLLGAAFRAAPTGPKINNWRKSGLVISPVGLALIQGDIRGELRWDELRDIRYRQRRPFFDIQVDSHQHLRGIDLIVEGATITIANVYDRPLALIHERLMAYWQVEDD